MSWNNKRVVKLILVPDTVPAITYPFVPDVYATVTVLLLVLKAATNNSEVLDSKTTGLPKLIPVPLTVPTIAVP